MVHPNRFLSIAVLMLCAGCGGNRPGVTPTADFITATLPPTSTPLAMWTPPPPTPQQTFTAEANISPIEGTTTTQLNVRAGPSTASESLGMIGIFAKVQVIGRDSSGSWYQILFAESAMGKGWVRAEYVQVEAATEIPPIEAASGSGSAVNGLVTQKVNVRTGPGTTYELVGALNPNDVVFITGRDSGNKWIQIEFVGAPDGRGWVTAEFLQAGNLDTVPQIGTATEEPAKPTAVSPSNVSAVPDGDSMQNPLTAAFFSPTGSRALQINGDVSAPNGDAEDWIQFTSQIRNVSIQVTCQEATLRGEIWNNGKPVDDFSCGEIFMTNLAPGVDYFLRLLQNETGYTSYDLRLEALP
jgi:uncharacterized protein YraI